MNTIQNLIQQLKDNEKPFGLMSEEMKKKAMELDIADFQYYTSDRKWEAYPAGDFYHDQACRLRPKYGDEREIVECEIRTNEYGDLVYKGNTANNINIDNAFHHPNHIGFKFEDGKIRPVPITWTDDRMSLYPTMAEIAGDDLVFLHATHVLFSRKKQE